MGCVLAPWAESHMQLAASHQLNVSVAAMLTQAEKRAGEQMCICRQY